MLNRTYREGDIIRVGPDVTIRIKRFSGGHRVVLGIEAAADVTVLHEREMSDEDHELLMAMMERR